MMSKRPRGAPRGNTNAVRHGGYRDPSSEPATAHGSDPGKPAGPTPAGLNSSDSPTKKTGPLPTLPEIVADLYQKQKDLTAYIQSLDGDASGLKLAAFNLYSQNASRLGRLVRMTSDMGGAGNVQKLQDAVNEALDILTNELGRPL